MDRSLLLIIIAHLIPPGLLFINLDDWKVQSNVVQSALLSIGGFFVTNKLIPSVAALTHGAGMYGIDLNKKKGPEDKGKQMYSTTFCEVLTTTFLDRKGLDLRQQQHTWCV